MVALTLSLVASDPPLRLVRYHFTMPAVLTRLRSRLRRSPRSNKAYCETGAACSWDAMRATYEEQAARGVPEAVRGLELIEQDRWPTSGRPREGRG